MPDTRTVYFGVQGVNGQGSDQLDTPNLLRIDNADNIYVLGADAGSNAQRIDRISPAGTKTLIVRSDDIDGFLYPTTISTFDVRSANDLYIGGTYDGGKIYRSLNGVVTDVTATNPSGYLDGPVATARFYANPNSLAVTPGGDVLVADFSAPRLRKVSGGTVSTLAGSGVATWADGTGTAASFRYLFPDAVLDSSGNYWTLSTKDTGPQLQRVLRKVTPAGVVTTPLEFTGATLGGLAIGTNDIDVQALCFAPDGMIYISAEAIPTTTYILRLNPATNATTIVTSWPRHTGGGDRPNGIVADSQGNIYLSYSQGIYAGTIVKVAGLFTPPPSNPNMSTLTDRFSTLDTAKWTPLGPVASVTGGLQLGDELSTGYYTSVGNYRFDSAQVKRIHAGSGTALWIDSNDSTDFIRIVIDPDGGFTVRAEWSLAGASGNSGDDLAYDLDEHRYLRMVRDPETTSVLFQVSADGLEWSSLAVYGLPDALLRDAKAILYGNLYSLLDDFNIPAVAPGAEPDEPDQPDDIPDDFDPDTEVPPSGTDPDGQGPGEPLPEPTCATLIELIREFSSAVRRPVRITGPSTIEMVDINAPLPTGWTVADSADVYSTTTRELTAGAKTLSMDAGLLELAVSADLVTNDARLITSDWQIPHQLPVYGLAAGLVHRITYTFTPTTFRGAVNFYLKPVPLTVRSR